MGVFLVFEGSNSPPQAVVAPSWTFGEEVMVEPYIAGRELAVRVSGILRAGGREDTEAVAPLPLVQEMAGRPGEAREWTTRVSSWWERRRRYRTIFRPSFLAAATPTGIVWR